MASGWVIAIVVGFAVRPLLGLVYGILVGTPPEFDELTAAVAVIAVVSGSLAYLAGGYAGATLAGYVGGKHEALTAIFGLIMGSTLAAVLERAGTGLIPSAVTMPPASFGLTEAALLAGLILFAVNLFGGFVGGTLGDLPSHKTNAQSSSWVGLAGRNAGRSGRRRKPDEVVKR